MSVDGEEGWADLLKYCSYSAIETNQFGGNPRHSGEHLVDE